ncbi:MAG: helix-turn-helix domain-containing protein [Cytophagales bacterium]|nr:helix-turn-helix domain-containing protein [Cytophagales bacterium]
MKKIAVVIPKGELVLSSVVGPFKIFNAVNQHLIESGKRKDPYYDVKLVGPCIENNLYDDIFTIRCHEKLGDSHSTDLVIIPSIKGDMQKGLELNLDVIDWIKDQYKKGAELASFCMGAFILASTGLVDNRKCSTHWMAADLFKTMFPDVNLVAEKIVTEENGIYTSGGAYSFLNLVLHLVEKFTGRETAIWASKVFEIEIDRVTQSHFTIFNTQKIHGDETILKAQEYIESHYDNKLSVESLADYFALSRRNFIRKFKKATQNSPSEYIQRVKMEAAKKHFEMSSGNVSEVMYTVGYNDMKSFRKVFKKITGLTPNGYRTKYGKVAAVA